MYDTGWEYLYLKASTVGGMEPLVARVNDLGVEGWELVTLDDVDRTIGANVLIAIMRRRLEPFDAPADTEEGWKNDPSGRFDKRHWNGRAWTFYVGRTADKSTHRDPPTRRAPTPDINL